jgi:translation initiation factor IF-2
MPPMSANQALQLMYLHQKEARAMQEPPRPAPPPRRDARGRHRPPGADPRGVDGTRPRRLSRGRGGAPREGQGPYWVGLPDPHEPPRPSSRSRAADGNEQPRRRAPRPPPQAAARMDPRRPPPTRPPTAARWPCSAAGASTTGAARGPRRRRARSSPSARRGGRGAGAAEEEGWGGGGKGRHLMPPVRS